MRARVCVLMVGGVCGNGAKNDTLRSALSSFLSSFPVCKLKKRREMRPISPIRKARGGGENSIHFAAGDSIHVAKPTRKEKKREEKKKRALRPARLSH